MRSLPCLASLQWSTCWYLLFDYFLAKPWIAYSCVIILPFRHMIENARGDGLTLLSTLWQMRKPWWIKLDDSQVVLAETVDGDIAGGYNPQGWIGDACIACSDPFPQMSSPNFYNKSQIWVHKWRQSQLQITSRTECKSSNLLAYFSTYTQDRT